MSLFSNAFRYKLLEEKGGWWVDLDVVCQTDALPEDPYAFGFEDGHGKIGTAVIKAPPGDPLMRLCRERSLDVGAEARWGQSGPNLFTDSVNALGLTHHAQPVSAFYPYSWTEALAALDPGQTGRLLSLCDKSKFVHLWAEVFRRRRIDKHQPPELGSLVDHFFGLFDPQQQKEFRARGQLCSNWQCLLAAFSIKASLPERLLNLVIAARSMSNTKHYIRAIGEAPNYFNPAAYSEKMQCRKLFDRNPFFSICCDKLKARAYAEAADCGLAFPKIYWSGTDPDQIPFDQLPTPYVIKPNHRSGAKFVVTHKDMEDQPEIRNLCRHWLTHPHGLEINEWGYRDVKPCLYAEELLPAPEGFLYPDEYNFMVYSGRLESVVIFRGRQVENRDVTYLDRDWTRLDVRKWVGWHLSKERFRDSQPHVPHPDGLERMIAIAERLGRDLDHVRVDFFNIDGIVYFCELTVYADSGFAYGFPEDAVYEKFPPRDIDYQDGALWKQPQFSLPAKLKHVLFG